MQTVERIRSRKEDMARARRNDVAVKLAADVVKMARHLAVDRGVPLAQYLSDRLRPFVVQDFEEMTKRLKKPEQNPKPPKTEK
jgi:hypothetical protein